MIRSCPRELVTAHSWQIVSMANFAEKGILPREGGLERQRQHDVSMIQAAWSYLNEGLKIALESGE